MNWKNLSTSLPCLLLFSLSSCRGSIPKWDGKLWAGDSQSASIMRSQENAAIACSSVQFDDYVCMSYSDFKSWVETYINGCKKWNADIEKIDALELWNIHRLDLIFKKAK